ncbi:Uncharacterized protein PECH_007233 [Penicillium ucsense]|uniref:Mediator of RNA polymerase II transcription subunit 20 n=1 Tax=Penicillium ucsense TaxID=2839758 RepID=A0A8J8VWR9_9EURO|nr:Uncharacterized protein PECM_001736 [Penicillium ucsense]KAF7735066.1 Uncharacterized protein PECH_007233 [Penicillium ucsense]
MPLTGVYFIPTNPQASTTLNTLTERLRATFSDEDITPIGRWALDHKLMRDTPGLLPQPTPQGQRPAQPRYLQLLSLSHYPTHGFIYTSEATEKLTHRPSLSTSASPVPGAASPAQPASAQIGAAGSSPMVMTTVPPAAYKTLFQHFTYACQPIWCHRLTFTVPNGIVYDVGDFRVRMGDVRQTFPAVRPRGAVVEIEWRGPSMVDSLAAVQNRSAASGLRTDSEEAGETGVDDSFLDLEEADVDAEYAATASLIREFWGRLGVPGAREAVLLPDLGKEVKEKLGKMKTGNRGGSGRRREMDEVENLTGYGGVSFENDVDPTAGTDVARQYME